MVTNSKIGVFNRIKNPLVGMLFIIIGLIVTGCGPITVGPVNPKPTVSLMDDQIKRDLKVYLSPRIQDNVKTPQGDMKSLEISGFRGSIQRGIENTFKGRFKSVEFITSLDKSGLLLAIDFVTPSLERLSGGSRPVAGAAMEYSAFLFNRGAKIGSIQAKVFSNEKITHGSLVESSYTGGLAEMAKHMYLNLLTEKIVRKIKK